MRSANARSSATRRCARSGPYTSSLMTSSRPREPASPLWHYTTQPIILRRDFHGTNRKETFCMAKKRGEPRKYVIPTSFEQARDELFSHILRCGVLEAASEHQKEWF